MYSSGSETNLFLVSLLPTPLAATFNQKRFKTDGLVMKHPRVVGPRHAFTKGSITPICNEKVHLFLCKSNHETGSIWEINIYPIQN